MLIGAHVSPAGGLPKAVERGVQLGCRAIQIFNQSPRMWRPTVYREEDVAAFKEAIANSPIGAVLIHTVYLLNCASDDAEVRSKSLESLTHSLRAGQAIGACGVVLHPGSAKIGNVSEAITRAGQTIAQALSDSEGCELHLENTAGAGGTLGRSFDELAALIEAAGADRRLGVCLDSCHLYATGFDIRTSQGMTSVVREATRKLGKGVVRSLHLNDSKTTLGANRDRHANIGDGELGEDGCASFLSTPSFKDLPCVLETAGGGTGPRAEEIALAVKLRERGIAARKHSWRGRAR
jgi:deoxyribonuclease IV